MRGEEGDKDDGRGEGGLVERRGRGRRWGDVEGGRGRGGEREWRGG